jgi:hypothetical protein
MRETYRSLALMCARGKFQVQDPPSAPEHTLTVVFRGGLVAYLNGAEIGRAGMPDGPVTPQTLALDYPKDVFVDKDGTPLAEPLNAAQLKDLDLVARQQKRLRRLEVKVPPAALRKGVNVLALEVHRAPGHEVMVTNVMRIHDWSYMMARGQQIDYRLFGTGHWWNRAALEEIRLTAPAETASVVPNISRPKGLQVWNESVFKVVTPLQYGDPGEPLRPVPLRGVRNGTCCGQVVIGSSEPVRGLNVTVSDLVGGAGGVIPSSAVSVAYARWEVGDKDEWQYESLDDVAPAELPVLKRMGNMDMAGVAGVVQPVWFVVRVPRDAKVGTYIGKVTIHVDGAGPVQTAIQLRIAGQWVAPDPQGSTLHVGMLESPDSIAMQYNVPMWSDEHWKLLDRTFELMGQLGNREVYIPVITKTQLGNEHSMVRWVKQDDGSYKHDFSIAEKYLDTAIRRLGPIHMVCFYVTDLGLGKQGRGTVSAPFEVTEYDPASKGLKPLPTPQWGTPESRQFWKPVVEGFQAMLAKRSLQDRMMMGMASNSFASPETVSDLKVLAPQVKWADCSHLWGSRRVGSVKDPQPIGRMATAGGAPLGVMWDPDVDEPHYNWRPNPKDDRILAAGPRGKCTPYLHQALAHYRLTCETTLLSSYDWFNGFGQIGADFFPVLKTPQGALADRPGARLDNRYVYWGSLNLSSMVNVMLGAGREHPVHTCRSQMFRESLLESEARVFVTDALLDDVQRAKLGPELAAECKTVCDDRTRTLRYCSYFFAPGEHYLDYGRMFNQEQWEVQTEQLYLVAEKVAKALGKN